MTTDEMTRDQAAAGSNGTELVVTEESTRARLHQVMTDREALERFKEAHPEVGNVGQIAALDEETFVRQYAATFDGDARLTRRVHKTAERIKQNAALIWANVKDVIAAARLDGSLFNNIAIPQEFLKQQESIPGYERLFGNLSVVECDDSRSIFGPAAYFVDLMRFVEENVTHPNSADIPDALKLETRRPDLAVIPLDRQNTFDLIPYIDLVNEALEAIVATSEGRDAYEALAELVFPQSLPFNAALEEIRAYLKQLKTSLDQLYQAFEQAPGARLGSIARERLQLSPAEFNLLVAELAVPEALAARYGRDMSPSGTQGLENVAVFLERTGLTRKELDDLLFQDLDRHEVNAGMSRLFFINNAGDGLGYLRVEPGQTAENEQLINLSPRKLDRIYRFLKLSRKLGWSFAELDWALRSLAPPYVPEKALRFDGVNDFVVCADVTNIDVSHFTVEAWVSPARHKKNVIASLIPGASGAAGRQVQFLFWINSDGQLAFYSGEAQAASASAIPAGEFTHVGLAVDGPTVRFYIDGRLDADIHFDSPAVIAATGFDTSDLYIGKDDQQEYFEGIIKEVRIWNAARTQEALAASRYRRMTGRERGLARYWPLTEMRWDRLGDLTPDPRDGLLGGREFVTQPTWVERDLVLDPLPELVAAGDAYHFNGIDQYLAARGAAGLSAAQWTIEAWVSAESPRDNPILTLGDEGSQAMSAVLMIDQSGHIVFKPGMSANIYASTAALLPGQRAHVCVAASEKEIKLYIDGDLDSATLLEPLVARLAGSTLWVGRDLAGSYYAGTLQELRIWNRARAEDEITIDMHRALAAGEPGLIGYWRLNERTPLYDGEQRVRAAVAADRSYNRNDLYLGGIPEDSMPDRVAADLLLPAPPIAAAGPALDLDGDNDVVIISGPAALAGLGRYESWTLELWFRPAAVDADRRQVLLTQGDGEAGLNVYLADGRLYILAWRANYELTEVQEAFLVAEGIGPETWHHISVTGDESKSLDYVEFNAYLDGQPLSSQAQPVRGLRLSPVGPAYLGGIGRGAITRFYGEYSRAETRYQHYFSGHVADLRIWKAAKTGAEIDAGRYAAPESADADLVAYLPLDEGAGQALGDRAGHGFSGAFSEHNIALVTSGRDAAPGDLFAHYAATEALSWSHYVYTGRLFIADADSAVGVTFFSRHPESIDQFYALWRSKEQPTFRLVAHPYGIQDVGGQVDSGISPAAGVWYRFLVLVEGQDAQTTIKAKLWPDGADEPAAFQIDAADSSHIHIRSGSMGIWTRDASARRFDNLQVLSFTGDQAMPLLAENFEPYEHGEQPRGWRDTLVSTSIDADTTTFATAAIGDTIAFGAAGANSELENRYTHYSAPGALDWANYAFRGRIYIADANSAIGLTFFSRFPEGQDHYYRLRRYQEHPSFHLAAHPYGGPALDGTTDSGVAPTAGAWQRFLIEAEDAGTQTNIRAKIWADGTPEPATFQIDAHDASATRLRSGTIGVWTLGAGAGYVDDLLVTRLTTPGSIAGQVLLSENVQQRPDGKPYQDGDKLPDWKTTRVDDDRKEKDDDDLFEVDKFNDNLTFAAKDGKNNSHAHYANQVALGWKNYAFSGRMLFTDAGSAIGVTVFSRFPERWLTPPGATYDRYYALRRSATASATFQLAAHPEGQGIASPLKGKVDSALTAARNTWYRFRVEAEDIGTRTNIRAKIWADGTAEPAMFQIDAYDDTPGRITSGTVGLWASGHGDQHFDDLLVVPTALLAADFQTYAAGQHPNGWSDTVTRSHHAEDTSLFATSDVRDNTARWRATSDLPVLRHPLNRLALRFDGQHEYLAAAKLAGLDLTHYTMEAWVRLAALPGAGDAISPILSLAGADSGQTLALGIDGQGRPTVVSDGQTVSDDSAPRLEIGKWAHIALAVHGSASTWYIDGSPGATVTLPPTLNTDGGTLEIGRLGDVYFAGQIKELRLWAIARSAAQIDAARYQRPDPTSAGLAGYWPLDESEGVFTPDLTQHNDLRLGGLESARQPTLVPPPADPVSSELQPAYALAFAAPTDCIQLGLAPAATPLQRRTAEVYFRVEDKYIAHQKQIVYYEGDERRALAIYVHDGALYFGGYNAPAGESGWAGTWLRTDRVASGVWHQAAIVLDGRAEVRPESIQGYLDGKLVASGDGSQLWAHPAALSIGGAAGGGRFHDGAADDLAGHCLTGQIMDLRIWDTARTPEEIQAGWRRQLSADQRADVRLLLWWQFDNSTETGIAELSGHEHNAAIPDVTRIQPIGAPRPYTLPQVTLDAATLGQLAEVKRLKDEQGLPIERLCALWFDIKWTGRADGTALYDQIFNPKGAPIDQWPHYADRPIRWDSSGQSHAERDRKTRSRLMAALRVSDADLKSIVARLSGAETLIELDHTYLARMYRLARTAGLLRLSLAELLRLLDMAGIAEGAGLDDLLRLAARAAWMQETGIDVYELDFLANDRQSRRTSVPYTDASIRDLADDLRRQSNDFLANSASFISPEISQLQSQAIFLFLSGAGFVDADGAITPKYTGVTDLSDLAADQRWAQDFASLDAGIAATLQQKDYVDTNGIVLKSSPDAWSDAALAALFAAGSVPSRDTLSRIREALEHRQRAQDKIGQTLARMRDEHTSAVRDGLTRLMGATPDLMRVVAAYVGAQFDPPVDARAFLRQLLAIAESQPIPDAIAGYLYKNNKILYLAGQFSLRADELAALLAGPDQFGVKHVLNPDVEDLDNLHAYRLLRDTLGDTQGRLIRLLGHDGGDTSGIRTDILELTGWEGRQLDALTAYFGGGAYNRAASLARLKGCFDLAQSLAVDVDFLIALVDTSDLSYDIYKQQAAALLNVLRAAYDDEHWPQVYKPIRDRLAVLKRDALLSRAMRAVFEKAPGYAGRKDPDVLYEYLLLDVQAGSEIDTSRIEQAIASVQLYVQRCMINLEAGVNPETIPANEWEWMKNYRVWEANRKVFLYPESYIEPELRDNKTPLFEELEQELMQTDITKKAVERAYVNYLDRFAEIANLKIVGSYRHRRARDESGEDVLYLVGRSEKEPKTFYYRELGGDGRWRPWEKIELAINADFAAPVYAFGRLFLFWAELKKETKEVNHQNVERYKPAIKFSYYNFSKSWVQPQTFLDLESELDATAAQSPKWQRVYTQRVHTLASGGPNETLPPETNAKVLQLDQATAITRGVPGIGTSALSWAFWANFANHLAPVTAAKKIDQTITLFNYGDTLTVTASNVWTERSLPGTKDAVDKAQAAAQAAQNAVDKALAYQAAADAVQSPSGDDQRSQAEREQAAEQAHGEATTAYEDAATKAQDANMSATGAMDEGAIGVRNYVQFTAGAAAGAADQCKTFVDEVANPRQDDPFSGPKRPDITLAKQSAEEAQLYSGNTAKAWEEDTPRWETTSLRLDVGMPGQALPAATIALEYGWQHITLTMQYAGDGYQLAIYRYSPSGLSTAAASWQRAPLPGQGTLAIGKPGPDTSKGAYTAQMSDFCLWSRLIAEAELETIRSTRKNRWEIGLVYPVYSALNAAAEGDTITLAASSPGLTFQRPSAPVLEFVEPGRERIILLYGDTVRSLADDLSNEESFEIKLAAGRFPTVVNYDLDLSASSVYVALTADLSINDYATEQASTLSRYTPGQLRQLTETYNHAPLSAWGGNFLMAILNWIDSSKVQFSQDNYLIDQVSRFDLTLLDIGNQPGWYLLDTKDEQFLVTAQEDGLATAEDRLRIIYGARESELDRQPVSLFFDRDTGLEASVRFGQGISAPDFKFKFERLSTYAIHELSVRLFGSGLDGMLSRESQLAAERPFKEYGVNDRLVIPPPKYNGTTDTIDFDGAYGLYYQEVFFHIPFLIANRLNANQQFAEAQKWYHYIFNPMSREPAGDRGDAAAPANDRYWMYLPFRGVTIEKLAKILADKRALDEYRDNPFDPHAIARLRLNAYQKAVVMKYIDNLLDWGDYLFSQDTREAINEAAGLYVLAFNLLGPRPVARPAKKFEEIGDYHDVQQAFGHIPDFVTELALAAPDGANNGSPALPAPAASTASAAPTPHSTIVTTFYVPENADFLAYWDRVEDRMFKIRHSLNLAGIFRQLALFEPPINPMELVRAVAGGRDIGSVLADLSVAAPNYRYGIMLDRARDAAAYTIGLGAALLAALEKRDAEELARLANTHEREILELMHKSKQFERDAAAKEIESLQLSRAIVEHKQHFYESVVRGTGPLDLNGGETAELTLKMTAKAVKGGSIIAEAISAAGYAAPDFLAGVIGIEEVLVGLYGGKNVGEIAEKVAKGLEITSELLEGGGELAGKLGEYARRKAEWDHEQEAAKKELDEIDKDIEIANLRLQIADQELLVHEKQAEQNEQIAEFFREKFTNQELYSWMVSRLGGLYFQSYKLAYAYAKAAEKALQFELPTTDSFISFGHWDSLKKGLLAGESLMLELNRMEKIHLDQDSRFQEIERNISMKRAFPDALNLLKTSGACDFSLEEKLFNRDFPGHYCRMIKTVAVSVKPSGQAQFDPYDSVNAMLTQASSKVLLQPDIQAVRYLMGVDGAEQPNTSTLRTNWRANQQIAISKADQDSGMFALNFFLDNRYFPFEGTGAVSSWRLEMPKANNRFDFTKIDDVIIHLKYTAKSDSGQFRKDVQAEMAKAN